MDSVGLRQCTQEYQKMDEVRHGLIDIKLIKKYWSDLMKVILLQVTLLDGIKAMLDNIKRNQSKVGQN